MKSVDLSIEIIAEDLLKAILDWRARIASLEKESFHKRGSFVRFRKRWHP